MVTLIFIANKTTYLNVFCCLCCCPQFVTLTFFFFPPYQTLHTKTDCSVLAALSHVTISRKKQQIFVTSLTHHYHLDRMVFAVSRSPKKMLALHLLNSSLTCHNTTGKVLVMDETKVELFAKNMEFYMWG